MKKKCITQIMISVMATAFIMVLACLVNIGVMMFVCHVTGCEKFVYRIPFVIGNMIGAAIGVTASYIVYKIKIQN